MTDMTPDPAAPTLPVLDAPPPIRTGLTRLLETDVATRGLGIERIIAGAGGLELQFRVAPAHVNGHSICHGGLVYALADSAVGLSANCESGDERWVTSTATIDYLEPAHLGDLLVARSRRVDTLGSRTRSYVTEIQCDDRAVAVLYSSMRRARL